MEKEQNNMKQLQQERSELRAEINRLKQALDERGRAEGAAEVNSSDLDLGAAFTYRRSSYSRHHSSNRLSKRMKSGGYEVRLEINKRL